MSPFGLQLGPSAVSGFSHARGGQFVIHVKALPGNPYDGHTLAIVIPDMEAMVGNALQRILTAIAGLSGNENARDSRTPTDQ
jgi:transposase, IS5 family